VQVRVDHDRAGTGTHLGEAPPRLRDRLGDHGRPRGVEQRGAGHQVIVAEQRLVEGRQRRTLGQVEGRRVPVQHRHRAAQGVRLLRPAVTDIGSLEPGRRRDEQPPAPGRTRHLGERLSRGRGERVRDDHLGVGAEGVLPRGLGPHVRRRAVRVGQHPQRHPPAVRRVHAEGGVVAVQHHLRGPDVQAEARRGRQGHLPEDLDLRLVAERVVGRPTVPEGCTRPAHHAGTAYRGRVRDLPFGTWPSPLSPDAVAAGQVILDEVRVDGRDTWWLEGRPAEGGRTVLVRHGGDGARDVVGAPWDVRSRVHEYGGGAYAVAGGTVVFSHVGDGRLRRLDPGAEHPVPVTPEGPWRFGGLVLHGEHVYAVREDHSREPEPANEVVRLDLHGDNADGGTVLSGGADFVSRPAVAPDGGEVAWVEWDHPDMPWDSTRLVRARLTERGASGREVVAGGPGVSVAQPRFGPDGALWFVGDASGWWTLHRDTGSGPPPVHDARADHAGPQWVLGTVDVAVVDADTALVRWWEEDTSRLGLLDARTGTTTPLPLEGVAFADLHVAGGDLALRRGLRDRLPEVVRGPLHGVVSVLRAAGPPLLHPEDVSPARPWTWRDSEGLEVHGLLHEPRLRGVSGLAGQRPPLVVMAHGGPTSRTEPAFWTGTQVWTTRGFAVLHVNFSGSTGYGRAYRDRLVGRWGDLDIDDVVTGARSLAAAGMVDAARLAVRGGSAGGYAVLRAMTTSDAFVAGTSLFGVADLAALAAETHKFESRYCDRMVAPWPEGEAVYRERSPIHHVDRLHGELLLLQGADDRVVPLAQAEDMAAALRRAGRRVELVVYPGEGHGFRRAETLVDALEREIAFYGTVMCLADDPPS
jgi:dipeptidyl aminopeptidase/acylaminoacyl peptidase